MIRSHTTVTGHLELCVLDPDGSVRSVHENHNDVMPSGQALLLTSLRGETRPQRFAAFLGTEAFEPRSEEPLEQEGVIRLSDLDEIAAEHKGATLRLQYRGIAERGGKIIGGGLAIVFKLRGQNKNLTGLYNFARMETPVEIEEGTPLLLTFTLSVG